MVALTRAVKPKHAMELLLTGELADAAHARDIGLVNRVVPPAELEAATQALARLVASKSPLVLKTGKQAFYRQAEMGLEEAYAYASRVMTENMMARDAEAGVDAAIAKRPPPEWQGR